MTNFEITKHFKYEQRFNGVYSINNLPKIKERAYVINLDHSKYTGTHWVMVFLKGNEVIYFDSFVVEYNSVMCGYFCILCIEFMLKYKKLSDFANSFKSLEVY